MFCGDAAMNGVPSLHKITIWAENKDDYLNSWRRMIELKPGIIYPGHGKPFCFSKLKANIKHVEKMSLKPLAYK